MRIIPIPYFNDNYAYAVQFNEKQCYLFDAGDGAAITEYLNDLSLTPTSLFITHNHHDHIDGIEELQKNFPSLTIILPEKAQNNSFTTRANLPIKAIHSPGHTLDHICYYLPTLHALITGDTIFAGGTGRCFTGKFDLYCNSLHRLTVLPGETRVYGAHEYLSDNIKFIKSLGRETEYYEKRISHERYPSVGIPLIDELRYNPLLQLCHKEDREGFEKLRKLKDCF